MPLNNRGRSRYNPVSSTDAEDDDAEHQQHDASAEDNSNNASSSLSSSNNSRARSGRRRSNNAGSRNGNNNNNNEEDTPLKVKDDLEESNLNITNTNTNTNSTNSTNSTNTTNNSTVTLDEQAASSSVEDVDEDDDSSTGERITIVILDAAQKKFPIPGNPDWTIQTFKKRSAKVHKVPPPSQRLIFRGKMLEDVKTLREYGLDTENVIMHLFPKPRVVVTNSSSHVTDASSVATSQGDDPDDENYGGAHIPQIFLDEEEQQRRGQILVLGSQEIVEAQNNVKLFSMLSLFVFGIRLLNLLSVASGNNLEPIGYDDDSTPPTPHNHTDPSAGFNPADYQVQEWETQNYYDLLVSGLGFTVAVLGIKATNENTFRLANAYMIGTVIAGIVWNVRNIWEYSSFVQQEENPKDDDDTIPLTSEDFVTVALFTVMMPIMIWFLCCTRAWQFRQLIEEAEQEAADRIHSQLAVSEGNDEENANDDDNDDQEENSRASDRMSSSSHGPGRTTLV